MSADSELLAKQKELKSLINKGMENAIPAHYFNLVGNALAKIFRLAKQPHRVVNATVLCILVFLPGVLVAFLTGEIYIWGKLHFLYIGLELAFYLGVVAMYINLNLNVLPGIRDHLIDTIQNVEDLNKISDWLGSLFSPRKWIVFGTYFGIPYIIALIIAFSLGVGNFVGFGISTLVVIVTQMVGSAFYNIFKILTLPLILSRLKLDLYLSNPANSEIMQYLAQLLNKYLYIYAGYMAFITSVVIFIPVRYLLWIDILSGWLPITAQFLLNQYSFRNILITAKRQSLRHLQKEIKDLENIIWKKASEANITRINQLMDLHDRISKTPNSMFTWMTGISFINQLMFPLLGLLIGNIDKLLKWINP